jgi:hypothetical protein
MASKKKKSAADVVEDQTDETQVAVAEAAGESGSDDSAGKYVGQWNRLVSTTNWEKGRIICQWREALELSESPATAFSDEAWAELVGGVTSQHVGRLRRVFQRFGAVSDQYEGLYWSHFQAGLDWDDAEMWLEGAIHNGWSVSQMRGKRWETLGNVGDLPPEEVAEADEVAAIAPPAANEASSPAKTAKAPRPDTVDDDAAQEVSESSDDDSYEAPATEPKAKRRQPLAVDVDDLPDDLAEAFEQFKLAIIAQRRAGWRETTPAAVIECLDALKELALAPADEYRQQDASRTRRVLLGVVERPLLDEIAERVEVRVLEQLITVAAEVFLVPHGAFGGHVQHVVLVVRADDNFQPAEQVFAAAAHNRQVVAPHGAAQAALVGNVLVVESREVLGQLLEARLDVLVEREAVVAVQPAALLFAERLGGLFAHLGVAGLLAAMGGPLQSFAKVHAAMVRDASGRLHPGRRLL